MSAIKELKMLKGKYRSDMSKEEIEKLEEEIRLAESDVRWECRNCEV